VKTLTREVIAKALELLAQQLPPDEPRVDLIIVGGAAMVLLFSARDSTGDVDGFQLDVAAKPRLAEAAAHVAMALELPGDWLNDAAKGYVHGLSIGPVLLDRPTLQVRTLSPFHLLAMKLSAWRDDLDVEDARRLLQECPGTRDDVWREVEAHVVPGREMKAQYAFDDLWESEHGTA
jgi:Nucleotidyltransferase of unknown function (DUF6036)